MKVKAVQVVFMKNRRYREGQVIENIDPSEISLYGMIPLDKETSEAFAKLAHERAEEAKAKGDAKVEKMFREYKPPADPTGPTANRIPFMNYKDRVQNYGQQPKESKKEEKKKEAKASSDKEVI